MSCAIPLDRVGVDEDFVWEDINRTLDHALGYGKTAADVQPYVTRGIHGMEGLYKWFRTCATFLDRESAVLEPRVPKLCAALEAWCVVHSL